MEKFVVYTDGGCLGNKRDAGCIGGFGYLVLDDDKNDIVVGGGYRKDVTNNIMELYAVIKGVEALIEHVEKDDDIDIKNVKCFLKTDSRYIVDNYYDYVPIWKKNGWRKRNGATVLNKKLWMKIDELSRGLGYLRFVWVKAHAFDSYNNKVDKIATEHMKRGLARSQ